MKKVMCLFVMLAMVASASATVRIFVTDSASGFGLENNANAFTPTVSTVFTNGVNLNTYDYYDASANPGPLRPGTYPPAAAPSGTLGSPVVIGDGGFAYVWLQFQNEPGGANINGLLVRISESGSTTPSAKVAAKWYLCNNKNTIGTKRWDGAATPPGYPEFSANPQTFVAITAAGISNLVGANASQLWSGSALGRFALLGAIQAPYDDQIYTIDITNISYSSPPNPTVSGGVFQFTPEPTSLLLMGLAGLLLRRR